MIKAGLKGSKHKTIRHWDKVYVDGDMHTNTVVNAFSLLKRGIVGIWHEISAKHLPAYICLDGIQILRENPDLFGDTLREMVTGPLLTCERLTA